MRFQITVVDGEPQSVTVVTDDGIYTALADHHASFSQILDALAEAPGDESVVDLFDIQRGLNKRFEKVSERVILAGGQVLFDGEAVVGNDTLVNQILRFADEDADFGALVNFLEKVQDNPSDNSREQLWNWINTAGLTLTPEGDIIAYKGVRIGTDGEFTSINRGPAYVDGDEVNGYVPNPVGATVEIARSAVDDNPHAACSSGLHVGNWRYAEGFAQGAVLKVRVNPRDFVSVPHDSNCEKGRVCRYVVLDVVDAPVNNVIDDDVYDAPVTVTGTDTRRNHLSQRRGPDGRFLPKNA